MELNKTGERTADYPVLHAALLEIAKVWSNEPFTWLLGGSCGLLLQEVELQQAPRDIDIYADIAAAKMLHRTAPGTILDEPQIDKTGPYASLLSHYQVGECALELVGGFEIWARKSWYRVEIDRLLAAHAPCVQMGAFTVKLMPLAHELLFNVLRGRVDRYEAIAKQIRKQPHEHQSLMLQLSEQNVWTSRFRSEVSELIGFDWHA